MKDLVIIGAGPAGLGAAVYAKRAGLDTLVLDTVPTGGGQITSTYEVDNYLGFPGVSGMELAEHFLEHAKRLGAEFEEAEVTGLELKGESRLVKTTGGDIETRTVIIASGATHAHLGVPGEEELLGMGVSYCATCDGAFFKGRTVCVVGGGDVAVEDAIFLSRICAKVYLIHRRDELRAAKRLQEALFSCDNVECVWNSSVTAIEGEDEVTGVRVKGVLSGEGSRLSVSGVFIAVGITPESRCFAKLGITGRDGYMEAGEDCITAVPGVFAAGDVRKKPMRQIITAVADGANAVNSAAEYIKESR